MKRRIALFLALVMVLGILFSACGAAGPATSAAPASVKPAESALATPAPKQPVTLKFTYWGSPIEKDAVVKTMANFQKKYPYITVDAQHIPADYETKITTMVAGNTAPDIAYLGEGLAFPWAEEGKIYNILEFLDKDTELKKESFLSNIWYDWAPGKSIGTNTAVEAFAIFYNKELTEKAGVTVPITADTAWTWEQFVEAAQKLTIDGNGKNALDSAFDSKNIKQYGVQFGTWWAGWLWAVYSNGGDYLNADGTEFTLTKPEAVEAIQKMSDLINKYHVCPSPIQSKALPAPTVSLQSKQVAMSIDGQWCLLDLGAADFKFGVGVLPKLKTSITLVLGSPTVIFKSTKYPEEAWLLYKWLANPESSIDLQAGGLWMPLLKDWYTKPELISKWAENNAAHPDGYKDAIMKQTMTNGVPGPSYTIKNFAKIDAIVGAALEQVWLGEKTAKEALDGIADKVKPELKGRYGK